MDGALTDIQACAAEPCKKSGPASEAFRRNTYPIPIVPIEIDDTRAQDGAGELLRHIRPGWSPDSVQYTVFTAGYTNILIGCSLRDGDASDVVLVRIYGRGTNLMIDRQQERNSMVVLHTVDCAAPVYCRFKNGIAYGFQPGIAIDCDLVRQPNVQKLIVKELVRMHSVDLAAVCASFGNGLHFDMQPSLFRTMFKWLGHVPDSFDDEQKQAKLERLGYTKQQFAAEVECLERNLTSLGSPVVFCHNDLLPKNIVYNEELQRVHFIDFEYVSYNYQAFDIANHFCEYAGMVNVDFSMFPSREYQLVWLRTFLETSYSDRGLEPRDVTDTDVERLYVQVQKFSLASHLFWAFWALIQARHSSIDYDYIEFAGLRLAEYRARKDEFLSIEMP